MNKAIVFLFFILFSSNVLAANTAILQSSDGTAISAANPLYVTLGAGSNLTANVGISSASPGAALDVTGDIRASGFFRGDGSLLTGITSPWSSASGRIFPATITDNVGIGTTTPSAELEIESTANNDLFIVSDNGPGDTSPFIVRADGNVGIGSAAPGQLLDVNGNIRTISSGTLTVSGTSSLTGNVSINTTNSDHKLNVNGRIVSIQAASTYGVGVRYDLNAGAYLMGGTNAVAPDLVFSNNNGDEKLRLTNGGNVGIGTTGPREALEVNGYVRPTTGYKSADGTAGATVTTCTGFKNGLCISGT